MHFIHYWIWSPSIYSNRVITESRSGGTVTWAQAVIIEGKSTASVLERSNLTCKGIGTWNDVDIFWVMLFQSMSGVTGLEIGTFNWKHSTITIDS